MESMAAIRRIQLTLGPRLAEIGRMDPIAQDKGLSPPPRMLVGVIDANESHRRQVAQALISFYQVATFANCNDALAGLHDKPLCAILVDQSAPPLGGAAFIRRIRRDNLYPGMPIVLTGTGDEETLRSQAFECGANSILTKPYRRSALIRIISHQINKTVEKKWEALPGVARQALVGTMEVFNSFSDMVEKGEPVVYSNVLAACGPLVEAVGMQEHRDILAGIRDHDNYSYAHSLGTATLLLLFGYAIGLKDPDLSLLGTGGLLHDIGKMSIPYEVLNKAEPLTADEFDVMKSHVPLTLHFLGQSHDLPKNLLVIAAEHHERLDGSGYPRGRKGAELNELSRMAAIVDVFCALSERRAYRPAKDAETALRVMTEELTSKLDQTLLALFREMLLDTGR